MGFEENQARFLALCQPEMRRWQAYVQELRAYWLGQIVWYRGPFPVRGGSSMGVVPTWQKGMVYGVAGGMAVRSGPGPFPVRQPVQAFVASIADDGQVLLMTGYDVNEQPIYQTVSAEMLRQYAELAQEW